MRTYFRDVTLGHNNRRRSAPPVAPPGSAARHPTPLRFTCDARPGSQRKKRGADSVSPLVLLSAGGLSRPHHRQARPAPPSARLEKPRLTTSPRGESPGKPCHTLSDAAWVAASPTTPAARGARWGRIMCGAGAGVGRGHGTSQPTPPQQRGRRRLRRPESPWRALSIGEFPAVDSDSFRAGNPAPTTYARLGGRRPPAARRLLSQYAAGRAPLPGPTRRQESLEWAESVGRYTFLLPAPNAPPAAS